LCVKWYQNPYNQISFLWCVKVGALYLEGQKESVDTEPKQVLHVRVILRSFLFMRVDRNRFLAQQRSAVTIQKFWRGVRERRLFQQQRSRVVTVQSQVLPVPTFCTLGTQELCGRFSWYFFPSWFLRKPYLPISGMDFCNKNVFNLRICRIFYFSWRYIPPHFLSGKIFVSTVHYFVR